MFSTRAAAAPAAPAPRPSPPPSTFLEIPPRGSATDVRRVAPSDDAVGHSARTAVEPVAQVPLVVLLPRGGRQAARNAPHALDFVRGGWRSVVRGALRSGGGAFDRVRDLTGPPSRFQGRPIARWTGTIADDTKPRSLFLFVLEMLPRGLMLIILSGSPRSTKDPVSPKSRFGGCGATDDPGGETLFGGSVRGPPGTVRLLLCTARYCWGSGAAPACRRCRWGGRVVVTTTVSETRSRPSCLRSSGETNHTTSPNRADNPFVLSVVAV